MSTRLALLCLLLVGCDGFPILGPLLSGDPERPTGGIRITLPCHDEQGRTFPCPPPAPTPTDSLDKPVAR